MCALAYVDPASATERVFFGYCTGRLAEVARGSRGFGYDPAFLPDGDYDGRTMAELTDSEKDAISHRAGAVAAIAGLAAGGSYRRLMPAEMATANVTPA